MSGDAASISPLLSALDTQPRVRDFLRGAVASGRTSHAYLFLGASGAGKLDAAWALAQALLCDEGGCGACDDCRRVARRSHPDVHLFEPESATGYLIGQTRELLEGVALAPIRARGKVYIIDRAEQLRANTANALLKTLEEPPAGVTFILLGTSREALLPTIASRCQCVPFQTVSPLRAASAAAAATGAPLEDCLAAVSATASPARAIDLLASPERREARRLMVEAVSALGRTSEDEVLDSAKRLVAAVRSELDDIKKEQEERIERDADYLSRGALKQLEDRNKRELSARERSGIMEALAVARSLLRDVLMRIQDPGAPLCNADASDAIERLAARTTVSGAVRALDAVARAESRVSRNVTPQLAIEVMLFDIRKALTCP